MRASLLAVGLLVAFSACPELVIDPDTGGGEGGGDGGGSGGGSGGGAGGGGNAIGEVRIQHKRAPGFVNLQAGTDTKWNPAFFDGGAVFTTPSLFVTTQVTDSLSNGVGTVSATYDGQRVDGGVVISFNANSARGATATPAIALSFDDLDLCITGTTGSARLDVACEGTLGATGSGFASVLVGDGLDDGKYCKAAVGAGAQGALPSGGSQTAALVQGQRCFTVRTSLIAAMDASSSSAGTSSMANGKVTIGLSLVP